MYHDYAPPHEYSPYPHDDYSAFMMITLLTTILVLIRNLFAIIILMTYTQLSSLT